MIDARARQAWASHPKGKPSEALLVLMHEEALQEDRDRTFNRKRKLNEALHKAFKRRMNTLAFYPSTRRGMRRG